MKPGPLVTVSLDCGACSYEQAVDDVVYCTAPTIVASTGPREIGGGEADYGGGEMMIRHVRQPTETSCAQACISMITGIDVAELIARMNPGRKSGTRGAAIIRELRANGVRCGDRFMSLHGKPFPNFAIVRIVHPNKRGHVVVKHGRTWFDPMLEGPFDGDPPRGPVTPWAGGSRITSCLWIGDGMP